MYVCIEERWMERSTAVAARECRREGDCDRSNERKRRVPLYVCVQARTHGVSERDSDAAWEYEKETGSRVNGGGLDGGGERAAGRKAAGRHTAVVRSAQYAPSG